MKKIIIGVVVVVALIGAGVGIGILSSSLQKEKDKNSELENRIEKNEGTSQVNNVIENTEESITNNGTENESENTSNMVNTNKNTKNEIAGKSNTDINKELGKSLRDDTWVRNNISSSKETNKFIKISDIGNSNAYIIDSQLYEKHTVMLVYHDGNNVVVKKKEVPSNYKNISVDTKHNILVLGNLSKYLNEGVAEDEIALYTIDKDGFTVYGHSGEVPILNGNAISYGQFKSRTESIKQEKIELDFNGANLDNYEK